MTPVLAPSASDLLCSLPDVRHGIAARLEFPHFEYEHKSMVNLTPRGRAACLVRQSDCLRHPDSTPLGGWGNVQNCHGQSAQVIPSSSAFRPAALAALKRDIFCPFLTDGLAATSPGWEISLACPCTRQCFASRHSEAREKSRACPQFVLFLFSGFFFCVASQSLLARERAIFCRGQM